ncbi:MAG: hypothetical protein II249_02810 [Bacteroidaceae bacterium]|nr:hypothetical protein [Bacteroidaceae bacterium]
MKNRLAIYFSVLMMFFVVSSCSNDETVNTTSPYAYIKSFSIGSIKSLYPAFTAEGKDTAVYKTISFSSFPFTINQSTGEIYNYDSLFFATRVSKVVVNMNVEGVASIYNDATGTYDYFAAEDSIDFTSPRKFRITSTDGSYSKDYTISVNVHQVEPELLVWNRVTGAVSLNPKKAIESGGDVYVFGTLADRTPVFTTSSVGSIMPWSAYQEVNGLPKTVDFTTVHLFNGKWYALAAGDLYASENAEDWSPVSQGNDYVAIIGTSDDDGYMWLAGNGNIYRTADGETVEATGTLPEDFPLYGISTSSYALSHNKNIIRYMLVGYTDEERSDVPKVWSKLSIENDWVVYDNADNPYSCPALDGLAVVRYDNSLYAFGGKGSVGNNEVEAFNSFYISKDNGVVWKTPEGFCQRMPEVLKGKNLSFVTFVDYDNHIWIITDDDKAGTLKGKINRLGFKK